MKGYVFLSNSTKPSKEKAESRKAIIPGNVSRPCIKAALKMGYDVFLGVNRNNPESLSCDLPVRLFDAHTYRSITALRDNIIAYRHLSKIMKENRIECIHCNTPVGGMIGRICAKRYHVKKVIYTAHGFHFYKGAPFLNRTLYKWAEQTMAHWTDVIITMNQEDFEAAQQFCLRKGGRVYKVHGVGINLSEYQSFSADRAEKRKELGVRETDIVCVSAGDLIARKNYKTAIKAIAQCNNPNIHYLICGKGPEKEKLEALAKELNIEKQIHLLGFRADVKDIMCVSDVFIFSTFQEGLPRSLMEAMAIGLPCVVSNIRGNVDLIENGVGGYLVDPSDSMGYSQGISDLAQNDEKRKLFGRQNMDTIRNYDISVVESEIDAIYQDVL